MEGLKDKQDVCGEGRNCLISVSVRLARPCELSSRVKSYSLLSELLPAASPATGSCQKRNRGARQIHRATGKTTWLRTSQQTSNSFFFRVYDDMNDLFSQQMKDVLKTPFCHVCLELKKHAITQHSTPHFVNNGNRKALR